jgi:peroxiredoxin
MKFLLFVFALIVGTLQLEATTIVGHAPSYKGQEVKLFAYVDLFENIPVQTESARVDSNGRFQFAFDPGQTRPVTLQILDYKATLYVNTTSTYEINLHEFDPSSAPPLSTEKYLFYDFVQQDADSINFKLMEVNAMLGQFQKKRFFAYAHNRMKPYLPELEDSINQVTCDQPYVLDYKKYVLANQKLLVKVKRKEVFEEYIKGKALQYQNPGYVDFFNEFYTNWFAQYVSTNERLWLASSIYNENLDSLKLLLKQNDFLQNNVILERVLLSELYQEASERDNFNYKKIVHLIKKLERETKNPEIRQTSRFYLAKLEKLTVGNPAPDFELTDSYGNPISIKQFRGKYVYLDFWATWCEPCIKSMVVLNRIYPEIKDSVEVISISMDQKEKRFNRFVQKHKFPWNFAWAGSTTQIKKDYEVFAFPLYFLIDKEGKLIQAPAFAPGEGIEYSFKALFKNEGATKPEIWDWNDKKHLEKKNK